MTLVMIWREPADGGVWVVSDSRITSPGESGGLVVATDRAAKILPIDVVLYQQVPGQLELRPVKHTALGFAYAGSTLIGLQAFAAVGPLWRRLQSLEPHLLPNVADFALHLSIFVKEYTAEIAFSHGPQSCHCALVGWDESSGAPAVVKIEAHADGLSTRVRLANLELGGDGRVHFIGSGSAEAQARLAAYDAAEYFEVQSRRPLQVIRRALREDAQSDVGGGVQIGYAARDGFELFFDGQPLVPGSPFAVMRYRGFDFTEIGIVGPTFINLRGVS